MGLGRTAWHVAFARLLVERAPAGVEVRSEVMLGSEPQRADLLLVRRSPTESLGPARVLHGLWSQLSVEAIFEFKSVSRPVRAGDLARLLGYGAQHFVREVARLEAVASLSLVLVVACRTRALDDELGRMGLACDALDSGYERVVGCTFPCLLVALDDVAEAERDDLLGAFGRRKIVTRETRRWWHENVADRKEGPTMQELDDYDEMEDKFIRSLPVERRLLGLAPEERLAGLAPEERLAGLTPEERLAALIAGMTPDVLAGMSDDLRDRAAGALADVIRRRGSR